MRRRSVGDTKCELSLQCGSRGLRDHVTVADGSQVKRIRLNLLQKVSLWCRGSFLIDQWLQKAEMNELPVWAWLSWWHTGSAHNNGRRGEERDGGWQRYSQNFLLLLF